MAESTCKFYIIFCTTYLPTLVKYVSMLEGLNKSFSFVLLSRLLFPGVTIIFVDGSLDEGKS